MVLSQLFVYNVERDEKNNNVLLYGIDMSTTNTLTSRPHTTTCWRVHDVAWATIYLELSIQNQNQTKLPTTDELLLAQVYEFIPSLRTLKIKVKIVEKFIAPVVSFSTDISQDRPPNFNLNPDKLHHNDDNTDYNRIWCLEVKVFSNPSTICNFLTSSPICITDLPRHIFQPTSNFTRAWLETLEHKLQEFLFTRNFSGFGLVETQNLIQHDKDNKIGLVASTQVSISNHDMLYKCPTFTVCFIDAENLDNLYCYKTQWSPHQGYVCPSAQDDEENKQVPFLLTNNNHKVQDAHIVIVYKLNSIPNLKELLREKFCRGTVFIDSFTAFHKDDIIPKLKSKRLSSLAADLLGDVRKPMVSSPTKRIDIIIRMFEKFSILEILLEQCKAAQAPLSEIVKFSPLITSEWLMSREFYNDGYIIRTANNTTATGSSNENDTTKDKEEKISGGFVLETTPGIHEWVIIMDFMSQYPSIIRASRLCFTQLSLWALKEFRQKCVELKYLETHDDLKSKKGLPKLCHQFLTARQDLKQKLNMDHHHLMLTETDRLSLNCRIRVYKLLVNSMCGCIASVYFKYHNKALAQYITKFGQSILKSTKEILQEPTLGPNGLLPCVEIIGGDSDALYVKAAGDLLTSMLDSKAEGSRFQTRRDLLHDAASFICEYVNYRYPRLKFQLDNILSVMYKLDKKTHCAIPLLTYQDGIDANDIDFKVDKFLWTGISIHEKGIAQFILKLREQVLIDLMVFKTTNSIEITQSTKSKKKSSTNKTSNQNFEIEKSPIDVFFTRLWVHFNELANRIKLNQMIPEEFVICNNINQPIDNYATEIHPLAGIRAAKILHNLKIQNPLHPFGDHVVVGDTIEYVVVSDFTNPDGFEAIPFHIFMNGNSREPVFTICIDFYMKQLAHTICETLKPLGHDIVRESKMLERIESLFNTHATDI